MADLTRYADVDELLELAVSQISAIASELAFHPPALFPTLDRQGVSLLFRHPARPYTFPLIVRLSTARPTDDRCLSVRDPHLSETARQRLVDFLSAPSP